MNAPSFHPDVMPAEQARLLKDLGAWAGEGGYYLAGGTAIALRVGHRRSIDFDWFSSQPTVEPEHVPSQLHEGGHVFSTRSQSRHLIDGHIHGIRVTFVRYAYPTLEAPELWQDYGCRVASLVDLGCMKLAAIAQRGSRKDFIDIHALLEHGLSLDRLLADYRRKYNVSDVFPVLRGLTYFDDAEKEPVPEMLVPLDWKRLKWTLSRLSREAFGGFH